MPAPIYVELPIRAELDALWDATQRPDLHQQWDLRFTRIEYLPRPDPSEPQQFLYATRIGFGLGIEGRGESVGQRDAEGARTSALRFWSDDPRSLIRQGSGYWKYVPAGDSVRFLTWYDYRARFGALGAAVDGIAFRPLLGWATAWSFDRLRLWLEQGVSPRVSITMAVAYAVSRLTIAGIWAYHGVVPKLLFPDTGEAALLAASGAVSARDATAILPLIAAAEIAFAVLILIAWRWVAPLWANIALNVVLVLGVVATTPATLAAPFQPLTLGLALIALSIVAIRVAPFVPSASRCLRRPA